MTEIVTCTTCGRTKKPVGRDTIDNGLCDTDCPGYADDPNKKIVVTYSSINGNGYGGHGEIVMGTKGTLIVEREKDVLLFKNSATKTRIKVSQSQSGPTLDTTESVDENAVAKAATGDVSREWRVFALPASFLLDVNGEVTHSRYGALDTDSDEFRSLLRRQLKAGTGLASSRESDG